LLQEKPDLKKVAASYYNYYEQQPYAFRSASIALIYTKELNELTMVTSQLISDGKFNAETFDRTSVQKYPFCLKLQNCSNIFYPKNLAVHFENCNFAS
jgi:type 1 fimbria pilin